MERRQVEIPFSRDKKLELIERVKLPTEGYAPTRRKLRWLLTTLEMLTGRDGCFPSQETLAYRLATIPRTIRRHVDQLRAMGLLTTSRKVVHGCGRELIYHVQWDRLAALPLMTEAEMAWERNGRNRPEDGEEHIPDRLEEYRADSPDSGQIGANMPAQTEGKEEGGFSCIESSQENLPPPYAPDRANSSNLSGDVWRRLEDKVRAFGVDLYEAPVAAAATSGCTEAQILAAIAYAGQEHGWRSPQGALRKKLLSMRPGDEVRRHFPASVSTAKDEGKERRKAEEFDRQRRESVATQVIRKCRREHGDNDQAVFDALTAAGLPEHAAHFAGVPR